MNNDEIINSIEWAKSQTIVKDDKGLLNISIDLNELLNKVRADEGDKVNELINTIKANEKQLVKTMIKTWIRTYKKGIIQATTEGELSSMDKDTILYVLKDLKALIKLIDNFDW